MIANFLTSLIRTLKGALSPLAVALALLSLRSWPRILSPQVWDEDGIRNLPSLINKGLISGGMSVSDAKRLKELETENARLKKLLAESVLENEVAREALRKKW